MRNLVQVVAVSEGVAMELSGHMTPSTLERYNIKDKIGRENAVAKLAACKALMPTTPGRTVLLFAGPTPDSRAVGE